MSSEPEIRLIFVGYDGDDQPAVAPLSLPASKALLRILNKATERQALLSKVAS